MIGHKYKIATFYILNITAERVNMKNIQIPEELFTRLCTYFLAEKTDSLNEQIIKNMLSDKLEKMQKRDNYSKSLCVNKQSRDGSVK